MAIERTKEEQQRANEMFDTLRDELLKRELSNTESYDRAILTLSAASLGISLTAIRFVVPLESADYIWMVKSGWMLLLISIIISLYAYFMSNRAIAAQVKNAEDYYIHGVEEAFNRHNKYISLNSLLNKLTGVTFSIAIALIVLFVTLNINHQETQDMSKKSDNSGTSTTFRDSASVPSMQRVPSGTGLEKNSANIPTMQQAPGTQTTSQSDGSNSGSSSSSSGSSSSNSGK